MKLGSEEAIAFETSFFLPKFLWFWCIGCIRIENIFASISASGMKAGQQSWIHGRFNTFCYLPCLF